MGLVYDTGPVRTVPTRGSAGATTRLPVGIAPAFPWGEGRRCGTVTVPWPPRIGVLSNPLSGGNRKGLGPLRSMLGAVPSVLHVEACSPREISSALVTLAQGGVNLIAVNGGDGTVQAVLTHLLLQNGGSRFPQVGFPQVGFPQVRFPQAHFARAQFPQARLPPLAVVRAGTTSMIAGDVGSRGAGTKALARLLAWAARPVPSPVSVVERSVLRVDGLRDRPPVCGMFFGAGAILKGIEFCRERIHRLGLRDEIAPGVAALFTAFGILRRDPRFVEPMAVDVSVDHGPQRSERCLLLLVSTLERLFLGLKPYWGTEPAPLRYTAIRSRPKHFLRVLPVIARGRRHVRATPESGYRSRNVDELRLAMEGTFTLDGELFTVADASQPIVVANAGRVAFLRL